MLDEKSLGKRWGLPPANVLPLQTFLMLRMGSSEEAPGLEAGSIGLQPDPTISIALQKPEHLECQQLLSL